MDHEFSERYRRLDALTCAAAYVDHHGSILSGNDAFLDLWMRCGTGSGMITECPLIALFAQDDHDRVSHTLSAPALQARPWTHAARLARSRVPATAEFVPIRRTSQPEMVWFVTLRPGQSSVGISDSEASCVALAAGVVHDLRTPLQSVLGWASLLRRTREPERIQSALTIIERNAKVQMELLEDLLELLRPSPSRLQLRWQHVDLAGLVKAELHAVEPLAEERQVSVSLSVDVPSVDVEGNETDLRRIVANLVGNALKFTPGGGSIDCRVWRSGAWAGLVVRDSGRGIDPAFVPHIFDAFYRESGGQGWGLGLNVVRHLVTRHGGTVTARSAGRGCGTTFSVLLPSTSQCRDTADMSIESRACEEVDFLGHGDRLTFRDVQNGHVALLQEQRGLHRRAGDA